MLQTLKPKYVIVYGRMPSEIFDKYKETTTFINFPSDLQAFFDSKKDGD